jgi:hypothetical protein
VTGTALTREEKRRRIQSRTWYHSIEIEPGLVTPGALSLPTLRRTLAYLELPDSLEGLSVLDIGAWDGFYSFEAERRGARRAVRLEQIGDMVAVPDVTSTWLNRRVTSWSCRRFQVLPPPAPKNSCRMLLSRPNLS